MRKYPRNFLAEQGPPTIIPFRKGQNVFSPIGPARVLEHEIIEGSPVYTIENKEKEIADVAHTELFPFVLRHQIPPKIFRGLGSKESFSST